MPWEDVGSARDHASKSIAVRAPCNVNAAMTIAIPALAGLAGVPDHGTGYCADCTANNSPLHRIAGLQLLLLALFGARACPERDEQAQNEQCFFISSLLRPFISRRINAPLSFSLR